MVPQIAADPPINTFLSPSLRRVAAARGPKAGTAVEEGDGRHRDSDQHDG
jgi:hypothetical protein